MTNSKKTRCFFSDTMLLNEGQVLWLLPDETRHAQMTLRLQPGHEIRVTDGQGHEASAVIEAYEPDSRTKLTLLKILKKPRPSETQTLPIRLFAAYAAKGVMDELVEKGQELGVLEFYPLKTEHTVVSLSQEKETKVLDRWYKITRESSKQSGNPELMRVYSPVMIRDALKVLKPGDEALFFHPDKKGTSLGAWIRAKNTIVPTLSGINLFVGPEGGFSERELLQAAEWANELGVYMVKINLGDTILRMSTAVVSAIAAIKFTR